MGLRLELPVSWRIEPTGQDLSSQTTAGASHMAVETPTLSYAELAAGWLGFLQEVGGATPGKVQQRASRLAAADAQRAVGAAPVAVKV